MREWGPLGAFLLALADSSGIPLPATVDSLIVYVAVKSPAMAYLTAALSTAGSLIGCMILYSLARKGGEMYLERHSQSPRARLFREWFGRYGMVTVFVPAMVPFLPLPLKVFVLSAGALQVRPRVFLSTVLAARIPRFFGLAWLGATLGEGALPWVKSHAWAIGGGAAALCVALVVFLRVQEQRRTAALQ